MSDIEKRLYLDDAEGPQVYDPNSFSEDYRRRERENTFWHLWIKGDARTEGEEGAYQDLLWDKLRDSDRLDRWTGCWSKGTGWNLGDVYDALPIGRKPKLDPSLTPMPSPVYSPPNHIMPPLNKPGQGWKIVK